jgi:hypothetical protein
VTVHPDITHLPQLAGQGRVGDRAGHPLQDQLRGDRSVLLLRRGGGGGPRPGGRRAGHQALQLVGRDAHLLAGAPGVQA